MIHVSVFCMGFGVYLALLFVTGARLFSAEWWMLAAATALIQAGWGIGLINVYNRIRTEP